LTFLIETQISNQKTLNKHSYSGWNICKGIK